MSLFPPRLIRQAWLLADLVVTLATLGGRSLVRGPRSERGRADRPVQVVRKIAMGGTIALDA